MELVSVELQSPHCMDTLAFAATIGIVTAVALPYLESAKLAEDAMNARIEELGKTQFNIDMKAAMMNPAEMKTMRVGIVNGWANDSQETKAKHTKVHVGRICGVWVERGWLGASRFGLGSIKL